MNRTLLKPFHLLLLLLSILPTGLFAQGGVVTGIVKDGNGESLIGVNILVKGTSVGTVTDIDGNFELKNLDNGPFEIEASFVGYITKSFPVDLSSQNSTVLNIVLLEDVTELSEIVVIGYGTQKKSDLTSAVASISAEDLEQARASGIAEALQGRAAGVQISSNTGAPGSDVSVKIRGITSINGTDPIWIVDGVQSEPNSVNVSDIESMEILKDASSAAIYGANAGSGVVLITTKKGKSGGTKVTLNAYRGIQEAINKVDITSGPEFARMYHEYEVLANKRNYESTEPDTFKTYDYQDMIFSKALMQNYDLGVSGGNESSTFYMGVGYLKQDGILEGSSYDKISLRLNGEHAANKWLKVGVNSYYTRQVHKGFEEWELKSEFASPILAAVSYHSFIEPYGKKTTDSEYDQGWSYTPLGNTTNPLATMALKNYQKTQNNASATFFAALTPIPGLKMETRLTGSTSFGDWSNFEPIFYITGSIQSQNTSIEKQSDWYRGWNWQNLLSYNKSFLDAHNFSLLVGYESGYGISEWMKAKRLNLINQTEEMRYFNASTDDVSVSQIPDGSGEETSGFSYLGRFSYDYKGMILGQVNFRRDYSSLFGPEYRSGNFPSFSAGFKFTELDVVKNALPFMNFGKIRYGWGKVGNNAISPYKYYSTISYEQVYNYNYNNDLVPSSGAAPNLFVNKSIHWEEVVTSNVGMDLHFLQSRLTLSTDYFERHNVGMLMTVPTAGIAGWYVRDDSYNQEGGYAYPIKNVGQLNNKGIEIQVGFKEKRGIFNYGVNMNITYIKTMVGDIDPDTIYQETTKGVGSALTRIISNQPFDIFYGYETDGLFRLADTPNGDPSEVVTNQPYTMVDGEVVYAQPNAKPGDFKFKDTDGNGVLDENDMVALGSPHPKMTFGLGLFADIDLPGNWGVVDVKAFLQGSYGNKIFNATKFYLYNTDGAFNWGSDYYSDHYTSELYDRNDVLVTEANDNATYPRIDALSANANFTTISDFYVEDASYLRIKNLELGYTLPNNVTNYIGISQFRVYGAIKNLLTFTKYSGLDPEVGTKKNDSGSSDPRAAGIDKAAYPSARMYTIGVNVTF